MSEPITLNGLRENEFVVMYGTNLYGISRDARIVDLSKGEIVLNPWLTTIDPHRPFGIPDGNGGQTVATLAQFVTYTFYGVCNAKIRLQYENEPPTASNCYYVATLTADDDVNSERAFIEGEEFRAFGVNEEYTYYVNRRGVVISLRRAYYGQRYELRFIEWSYKYGYPEVKLPRNSGPIHVIVWNAWSDTPFVKGHDIHHKDERRWNADINNLEMLPIGEHKKQHSDSKYVTATIDDLKFVFQSLQEKKQLHDIADQYSTRKGIDYALAYRFCSRVLYKDIFPDIRKDYTIDRAFYKANKNREGKLTDSAVENAIIMLLTTSKSDAQISRDAGLGYRYVRCIRLRDPSIMQHPVVAKYRDQLEQMNFDERSRTTGKFQRKIDIETIRAIIDLRQRSNYTNSEIALKYGCSSEVVRNIVNGEKSYEFAGPVESVFSDYERRSPIKIILPEDDERVVAIKARMKQV